MGDDAFDSRIGQALVEGGSEAVIVADREGRIVLWNPGAERMFGFTAAEARGGGLDIIIPESLRARHWKGYARVMETGQSRYSEGEVLRVPGRHADGHRLSLEFTLSPQRAPDGTIEYLVAVLRDQSARFDEMKQLREQLARTRSG